MNETGLFLTFVYEDGKPVTFKEVEDCTMEEYLKMVGDKK